ADGCGAGPAARWCAEPLAVLGGRDPVWPGAEMSPAAGRRVIVVDRPVRRVRAIGQGRQQAETLPPAPTVQVVGSPGQSVGDGAPSRRRTEYSTASMG